MYNGSNSEDSDHRTGDATDRSWASTVDPDMVGWCGSMKAILELEGVTYDAVLTEEMIELSPVDREHRKRKSTLSRTGSRSTVDSPQRSGLKDRLFLRDILGVQLRRAKHSAQKGRQGVCIGFTVYAVTLQADDVTFQVFELPFGHPSEQISRAWCQNILSLLRQFTERPKAVKVFVQPFSGKKMSRHVYNSKVLPLFEAAAVLQDITEIHEEGAELDEEIDKLDIRNYSSVICVGGDGTVGRVTTALINKANKLKIDETRTGAPLRPSPLPIGIIPTGTVNQIIHSVIGTDDTITAAVHILLGHRRSVDVFSVYSDNRLVCWSYFAHYGFFAAALDQTLNYTLLGEAKIEASVMATVRKYKCWFNCRVQYTVADSSAGNVTDVWPCRQGCQKCADVIESQPNGRRYRHPDEVMAFSDTESSSDECAANKQDESVVSGALEELEGRFVSASVMCTPALSGFCPLGMSKYTHLSDGYMDVILVSSRNRKEFIRYLKRMGKNKNQLSLPLIKTLRCKEITFQFPAVNALGPGREDDADANDDSKDYEESPRHGGGILNPARIDSSDDEETNGELNHDGEISVHVEQDRTVQVALRQSNGNGTSTPKRQKNRASLSSLKPSSLLGTPRTSTEQVQRRMHGKRASKWNINNTIKYAADLTFRVHSHLMQIHGKGVTARCNPEERKMPCLSLIT